MHVYVCARVHVCLCVCVISKKHGNQAKRLSNPGGLGDPKKKQPDRDG